MRIMVIGAGGLGGYLGGLLARNGEDVTFVARGDHLRALRSQGLQVKSVEGDFALPVRALERPEEAGPVDLIIMAVKTYDVESAGEAVRPVVGPETAVLCLQNGVDTEDRLAAMLGREHILGGAVSISGYVERPGVIRHAGGQRIILGEMNGTMTPRVDAIAATLQRAGIKAEPTATIVTALWEKFVSICGFSGTTATARVPLGRVWAQSETREMFRGLMTETASVGIARGVPLSGVVDRQMTRYEQLATGPRAHIYASLYADLQSGRRLEVNSLAGAVVRMGREANIPTPLNFAVLAILAPHRTSTPASVSRSSD
jgi:2-dehydropantoate 2-reductase